MVLNDTNNLLNHYKQKVEDNLQKSFSLLGEKNLLKESCEYAFLSGGKRLRPIITMMVAKALNKGLEANLAALAVEFFHTSSLIADDMPCMDNDDYRRGKPTVHKVYGETTALLASFALISAGYQMICEEVKKMKAEKKDYSLQVDTIGMMAVENASYSTGILGITGGQFLDIYPPDGQLSTIKEVVAKKTAALFETSFVFGWLFGGGDIDKLDMIKKAAYSFGIAFQMLDDIGDVEQDISNQRDINYAIHCGKNKTVSLINEELETFKDVLVELDIFSDELQALVTSLKLKAQKDA